MDKQTCNYLQAPVLKRVFGLDYFTFFFQELEGCLIGVFANFFIGKVKIVNSPRNHLNLNILAQVSAIAIYILHVQDSIAAGVFLHPFIILDATVTMHDQNRRRKFHPTLHGNVPLMNSVQPPQIDGKTFKSL